MLDNSNPTYFDDMLCFAGLHALSFSEQGDLLDIRPASSAFCGWSAENLRHFNVEDHFLEVNQLPLSGNLSEILSANSEQRDTFVFGLPDGGTSEEMRIMWQIQPANGVPGSITALVSTGKTGYERNEDIDKKYYFQAIHLPGFFHNLNGPLGTIIGRIELLQHQYPEIKALKDLIRVSNNLHEMVQTLSFKVHNERSEKTQPMNLSRFLRNELSFLKSDHFFKHQVETFYDLSEQVPQFNSNYAALSGVLAEFYELFRSMARQNGRYTLLVKSFRDNDIIGFSIEMNGAFRSSFFPLPLQASAAFNDAADAPAGELLNPYLRFCMEKHKGRFTLNCQEDRLSLSYSFPIIH